MLENAKESLVRSALIAVAVALLIALCSESTLAQCAMCRASLAGNSAFVKHMNLAVFVLLVPPVSIFCTIFILAFRHRKSG